MAERTSTKSDSGSSKRSTPIPFIEGGLEDRPVRRADDGEAAGADEGESEEITGILEASRDGGGSGKQRSPEAVLESIGNKFKKLRAKSQVQAHRFLIDAIAANLGVMCVPSGPNGHIVLNLKDAMAMIREHEEFVKGSENAEKSPLEALKEFLQ